MYQLKHFSFLLIAYLLVLSCSDEIETPPKPNVIIAEGDIILKANSILRNQYKVNEGGQVKIKFKIESLYSEAIVMTTAFNPKGINGTNTGEDFKEHLEYSLDDGETWLNSGNETSNKIFEIPAGKSSVLVKLETINDDLAEVYEEILTLVITLKNPSESPIPNVSSEIDIVLIDDELDLEKRRELDNLDPDLIVLFDISSTYEFSVSNVIQTARHVKEKEIIDYRYIEIINALKPIIKLSPEKLINFGIKYNETTTNAGFVNKRSYISRDASTNEIRSYRIDDWTLVLNMAFAYRDQRGSPQEFNADGVLGRTVVHELGHIVTLNDNQLVIVNDTSNCTSNTTPFANENNISPHCYNENSYMHNFATKFYSNNQGIFTPLSGQINPKFVTEYAQTGGIKEDIAESFSAYVCARNNLVDENSSNSAYQNKIASFKSFPDAETLKTKLLALSFNYKPYGTPLATASFQPRTLRFKNCVRTTIVESYE